MKTVMAVLGMLLLSCTSSTPPVSSEPRIDERVRVLADELVATAIVEDDNVTFPLSRAAEIRGLSPGDIVVSGYKEGFLRRVVSVTDAVSGIVVETVVAALTDMIIDGDLEFEEPIDVVDQDFSGKEICYNPGGRAWIREGFVKAQPSLRFALRIRERKITKVEFLASDEFAAKLVFEASSGPLGPWKCKMKKPLWTMPRKIFVKPIAGRIPLVIVVTAQLDSDSHIDSSSHFNVLAGAAFNASRKRGLRYEDGEWNSVHEQSDPEMEFYGPNVELGARMDATAGVSLEIGVLPYGLGGVVTTINAPIRLMGSAAESQSGSLWCAAFVPSVTAEAKFIATNVGSPLSVLWQGTFPFLNSQGTGECSLWDSGLWDQSYWQ